ncbi:BMP family ABC transporter substrate-binding protein [Lachnospiraceae bacterium OttesenSCG-928-D06]|nr:BMP family ABC transporter substrate-binding protein [Lachnospiraceae bacterium OttesenSCG-928-D06]
MKKLLAMLLTATMVFSLAACGSDTGNSTESTTESKVEESAEGEEASAEESSEENTEAGAALKIAIVSSPSGVDDGSFNQDNYNGVLSFIAENSDSTVTDIREESGDSAAAVQAVADVVADYDVIVCCGFQFAGIGNVAQDNPDTKFILIDSWPTIDGAELNEENALDNVYAAYYAEQESGFYAGMAAALSSTTGKVAVVNGIAYPSNVNYQYGFECGVKYVNETEDMDVSVVSLTSYAGTDVTGANVGGNYVGNFSDEATGKVVGNALIAEGVDIMFVAAGGSGNGVFTAAKEATDVMVIGCDVDQYDDGANGDTNIMLTSGLKVMHSTVYNALNAVKDGTFEGANVTLKADTDSTGFISDPDRCQLTQEAIDKISAAQAKIKSGDIVPAANFNGITPESFSWE